MSNIDWSHLKLEEVLKLVDTGWTPPSNLVRSIGNELLLCIQQNNDLKKKIQDLRRKNYADEMCSSPYRQLAEKYNELHAKMNKIRMELEEEGVEKD